MTESFPASMPVKQIDLRHADYTMFGGAWDDIDLLYQGGQVLRRKAERFLTKRPRELGEVYAQRVQRFTYQNVLGAALGWYQAAMFKSDPDIHIKVGDADVADPGDFYSVFLSDCERSGTAYVDFFRRVFLTTLLFRSAYVLIDLPKSGSEDHPHATLADQKASGALDPYLVLYDPRQAINWETDAHGNLTWIVFGSTQEQRAFGQDVKVLDRWYYFDRTQYAVYEARRDKDPQQKADHAVLVDSGPHALSQAGRVPVRRIQVPDGLWLANRVYLHAMTHLNMQNAYFWGLFMACLPVLWVRGGFQTSPTITETGYIEVAENGEIGYVEPGGTSYKIASEELATLREEMYRQMYLQAQGRSSAATASASSGYSKEMDMAPSRDVLNGFGDMLRVSMKDVLTDVAAIRGEADRSFDVRGFSFDDNDEAGELATAQLAIDLGIQSDTLDREVQKRAARVMLKDSRPEVVAIVEKEIDAAPSKAERDASAQADQRDRITQALQAAA